jgi:carbamoyltransferase
LNHYKDFSGASGTYQYENTEVTSNDVAKLIADGNIVSIFQSRSEAGPRALGNRSIVYDPRVKDGKDIVNKVKGREWFRPFAGSVLKEDAHEWFDLAGMEESPYMMYAVDVQPSKLGDIPAITHVDNTCRVQTVTEQQNAHFYTLIKAFKDQTGCPILFNTSFNLAGDPLVETFQDAIMTLERSELKYLYLPEVGRLLKKLPKEEEIEDGNFEVVN